MTLQYNIFDIIILEVSEGILIIIKFIHVLIITLIFRFNRPDPTIFYHISIQILLLTLYNAFVTVMSLVKLKNIHWPFNIQSVPLYLNWCMKDYAHNCV